MLVIPTWAAENGYIPPPRMVSHYIFGLFILKGQQIELHPKTSSWSCWSVTFSWSSGYSWMWGTLITFLIGTPTPRRGWTTRGVSRKPWPSVPSAPPPTSASTLTMSIPLLRPVISCITLSHLPFGSIFLHAPHPLFDIICSFRYPCHLCCYPGMSWPPCISSLFHISFCNGLVTFLYSLHGCIHLGSPPGPVGGAHQAESYIPCISQWEPFLACSLSKE